MNRYTIQDSFVISAGAGSGKTYILSRRYINAFLGFDLFREDKNQPTSFERREDKKAEIDDIVTMTYTNAAAEEMKSRIFTLMQYIINFLDGKKVDEKEIKNGYFEDLNDEIKQYVYKRLNEGIQNINESIITTIHGFSLMLIKRYSDYLKIDTSDVIDDFEQNSIFEKVYFNTINFFKDIEKLVEYLSLFKLKKFAFKYITNQKFRNYIDNLNLDNNEYKEIIKAFFSVDPQIVNNANEEVDGIIDWIEGLYAFNNPVEFNTFLKEKIGKQINKRHQDKYPNTLELKNKLSKKFIEKFNYDEELENKFYEIFESLKEFLKLLYKNYIDELIKNNKFDFNMIIEKVLDLLETKEIKFKYVMIDEFQDSNSLQFEIAKKIRGDNLFIVGDEKQSIYAFQGGEIEIFKKAINEELNGNVKSMKINRRSDKEIIKYVNRIFKKHFYTKDFKEYPYIDNNFVADYQKLEPSSNKNGAVEILYFDYNKDNETISEAEKEAKNIACLIKNIVDGNKYSYIKKEYIDKNEKAIGVIYNSKKDIYYLANELKKLGIVAKIHGMNDFWNRDEIRDAVCFLKAKQLVEKNKFDSFWIAGFLNSKAFNLSDKEIYEIINNKDLDKIKSMIDCNEEVLYKFVRKIFIKHKLYNKYDIPDLAKANIEDLIQELIRLEIENNYDYDKVLEVIEENFLTGEKPSNDYDSPLANSIEISSIHYTKGLAYPLVILANAHKQLKPYSQEGIKDVKYSIDGEEKYAIGFKIEDYSPLAYRVATHIDKLKFIEEKKRLLYVALTRAKHNIVISSKREEKFNENSFSAWLDLNNLPEIELECNENNKEIEYEIHIDDYDGEFDDNIDISPYFNASNLGEAVHKAIELYWDKDDKKYFEKIIDLYAIEDKDKFYKMIDNFKKSDVYKELQNSKDIQFELEFEDEEGFGRIDLVYEIDGEYKIVDFKTGKEKDYSKQLNRYKKALENMGYKVKSAEVLYLGDKQ